MGLWGNMADRVKGALCKKVLGNVLNKLPLSKLPGAVTSLPLVPNLFGGTTKKSKNTPKPALRLLGL